MDISEVNDLTREQILSADLISEVFEIEDVMEREEMIAHIQERAKAYGIKGQFDGLVKAQRKQIREMRQMMVAERQQAPIDATVNTFTISTEEGDTTYTTGRWSVTGNGITGQDGNRVFVASYYPIIITRILANRETGEEKLELAWKKNGAVKTVPALRNVVSSNSKIVELSRYGFPATTETAKDLVRYLMDFEAYNNINTEVSTSKYGWVGSEFVPYTDKVVFDGTADFKALTESVCMEGSYDEWLDMVRKIRASDRKEPMVYLAASFGSILLPLLNLLPFIVNLYGETGKGKTVSLMLATSVWANPDGRGYIAESTSTANALEQRLGVLNHLPLMVDDLSKVRDKNKDKFVDLIYMLCAGGGKNRLNRDIKMRYTATWNDIILTNIERPLTDDSMRGGALNRVLDFAIEDGDIYADGNAVCNVINVNYGHAGPAFVEVVKEVGIEKIKEMVNEYSERIKEQGILSGEEKEQKQIVPLAVLMTADKLTEQYIFQDGRHMDLDYCMKSVKSKKQVSEMERAYKHFIDAYYINRSKFDTDNLGEVWGRKMQGNYVAVIPTALDRIAEQYNFNAVQFVKWCKDHDLLDADKDRLNKKVSFGDYSERVRCYIIRIDDSAREEDEGGFIAGEPDMLPDEPLPFALP